MTNPARRLYVEVLTDLAERYDAAVAFLAEEPAWPLVRAAASELRGSLELLMLSTLVTHRDELAAADAELARLNRKEARRLVRSVNPTWWPQPMLDVTDENGHRSLLRRPGNDWLREDEWDGAHSRASNILHAKNPFAQRQLDLVASHRAMRELALRLIHLLTKHSVYFDGRVLFGQIGLAGQVPRIGVVDMEVLAPDE